MSDTVTINDIKIECADGFELSGTLYQSSTVKAAVMIAPATGIKRQFYSSFAKYLSENGFGVLTFDNRGIGQSAGDSINSVNASLINWGRLDMTATLEKLKEAFPNVSYHLIGHSAGGQLVGLMDNGLDLASMFNFGSSSGSLHNSKYPFKIKSAFFLKVFIPLSNFLFGHTKSQWVGMGEPLPKLVSAQWSRWCSGTGYVKVDLDHTITEHTYDQLSFPALWVHADDDQIANYENVKDMIRVYSKARAEIKTIAAQEEGFDEIGHMKFFSSKKKKLWGLAVNWIHEHSE